jgi:hypothetical protein
LLDRVDINHRRRIRCSRRLENPISISRQNPIRLFSDGP